MTVSAIAADLTTRLNNSPNSTVVKALLWVVYSAVVNQSFTLIKSALDCISEAVNDVPPFKS